jgi:HEAT repeat protein
VGRVSLVALLSVGAVQGPPASETPSAIAGRLTDAKDEVQLKAIAEELNLFLVQPIVPRKRVGLVIEVRNSVAAEAIFSSGPLAIGTRAVPRDVLDALRAAARDDNPRVGLEALYAFGVLAVQPSGNARHDLLRACGPDLAAFLGSADPATRYAAARVLGRVFSHRTEDPPLDTTVGDALIAALNDADSAVRLAAMDALGGVREPRAVQGLAQLVEYYGNGREGDAALNALARIAHAGSAPLLTATLASKSTAERVIAIEGLARIGDPAALPPIQAAASRDRSDAAMLALAFATAMLSSGAIDPIVDALARSKLRDQAKPYLVDLASKRRAVVEPFERHADARVRADIADAVALARLAER